MAAEFVRPFRKSLAAKDDANDAEAVCTAMLQPNMRFVTRKSVEQQALLCLHRVRQGLIEERTALVNQLLAALHEYYPTALAAFEDWTLPAAWAFVEAFATPQALVHAGKRDRDKAGATPPAAEASRSCRDTSVTAFRAKFD